MKLITASLKITKDVLGSSSFDVKTAVEQEVLDRLHRSYEEAVGHSVSHVHWDLLKGDVVELSTTLFEADIWMFKAQMMVSEQRELFKETNDV